MLYGFTIAPSINQAEPGTAYFRSLEAVAKAILQHQTLDSEDAMALCEYLDCVDSSALAMEKTVYGPCVQRLTEYLANRLNTLSANALANKSWAAKTLLELISTTHSTPGRYARGS